MKTISALLFLVCMITPAFSAKQYSYFRVGNSNDVTTATTAGTVLMGGGTDVDAAFQWMCGRAGNGDFLVIRATGTDAYNPYIQQLCPAANSVATLIIPNRAMASDPFVVSTILSAERSPIRSRATSHSIATSRTLRRCRASSAIRISPPATGWDAISHSCAGFI